MKFLTYHQSKRFIPKCSKSFTNDFYEPVNIQRKKRMKWIEAKVIFDVHNHQLATDLIANIFYDLELSGVVLEDPTLALMNKETGETDNGPDHYAVIGYFPKNRKAEKKLWILEEKLIRLEKINRIQSKIVYREIDEEDWAESWKTYFWPQKISHRVVIKPTWRKYIADPGDIIIEIDPGMAFGTGTHPTTAMCITMIENYLKEGASFLDMGTGSGILMVAAAKLGARNGLGIDKDEDATNVARENLLLNNIQTGHFRVKTGKLFDGVEEKFDLVVANISTDIVVILLEGVRKVLAGSGTFICSGMIEENHHRVMEKMDDVGLEILETRIKEGWVTIAGRKNS